MKQMPPENSKQFVPERPQSYEDRNLNEQQQYQRMRIALINKARLDYDVAHAVAKTYVEARKKITTDMNLQNTVEDQSKLYTELREPIKQELLKYLPPDEAKEKLKIIGQVFNIEIEQKETVPVHPEVAHSAVDRFMAKVFSYLTLGQKSPEYFLAEKQKAVDKFKPQKSNPEDKPIDSRAAVEEAHNTVTTEIEQETQADLNSLQAETARQNELAEQVKLSGKTIYEVQPGDTLGAVALGISHSQDIPFSWDAPVYYTPESRNIPLSSPEWHTLLQPGQTIRLEEGKFVVE